MPTSSRISAILFLALLFVGCKDSVDIDRSPANPLFSRLGGIAEVYMKYEAVVGGQPNESQLLSFGDERGGYTLDRLGVSSTRDLLLSKRDGQPIVLLLDNSQLNHDGHRVIAHEAAGVDGTRMVALDNGGAALLTEEEFEAARK